MTPTRMAPVRVRVLIMMEIADTVELSGEGNALISAPAENSRKTAHE